MANTPSAKKRARQNKTNRDNNIALKNRMRTSVKRVLKAASEGNSDEASNEYKKAQPLIDSLARKGVIHPNKAANQKSRLVKKIKSIA